MEYSLLSRLPEETKRLHQRPIIDRKQIHIGTRRAGVLHLQPCWHRERVTGRPLDLCLGTVCGFDLCAALPALDVVDERACLLVSRGCVSGGDALCLRADPV